MDFALRVGFDSRLCRPYHSSRQCYSSSSFDELFEHHSFRLVDSLDLFNVGAGYLDKRPLHREGIKAIHKSDAWELEAKDASSFYTRRTSLVVELIVRNIEKGKCLDIGCGVGLLGWALTQRGFDAYGTDISERMVQQAIQRSSSVLKDSGSHYCVSASGVAPFNMRFDLITRGLSCREMNCRYSS